MTVNRIRKQIHQQIVLICIFWSKKMIQLTDFINICRLCLTKHENSSVNLFSTRNAVKNVEETNELSVAEVVESFCNIEVRNKCIYHFSAFRLLM